MAKKAIIESGRLVKSKEDEYLLVPKQRPGQSNNGVETWSFGNNELEKPGDSSRRLWREAGLFYLCESLSEEAKRTSMMQSTR